MARNLEGKVALVTGGSRGIGRAVAVRLGREGGLVAVHYGSNAKAAQETVAEIEAAGGQAFALQADIGSVAAIRQLFAVLDAELVRRTGEARFDILVNNAGVAQPAAIADTTEELFDHHFNVNVKGAFFVDQQAVSRLRDGGRIIHVGSGVTRLAFPGYAAYAPTKGAIEVLNLLLAQELGPRGITVNSVAPGPVDTDMNAGWLKAPDAQRATAESAALRRVSEADDIADVAAFLASNDSRWVTGQRIEASGGFRL